MDAWGLSHKAFCMLANRLHVCKSERVVRMFMKQLQGPGRLKSAELHSCITCLPYMYSATGDEILQYRLLIKTFDSAILIYIYIYI